MIAVIFSTLGLFLLVFFKFSVISLRMTMDYGKSPKDDHYASILMELTLQYATLTDAHTFLLIETGTSRK